METDTHRARGRHKPAMRCTPCGVTASLRGVRRCRGASKLSPAMKPDPKDPLAVWADQALRQLPARRAPANADDALSALTRGGIVTAYVASRARPGTSDIVD